MLHDLLENELTRADLLIHPPDLAKPTDIPHYTFVRLSATHTNDNWYETNTPMPDNPLSTQDQPKWVTDLRQKLACGDSVDELSRHVSGKRETGAFDGEASDDNASEPSEDEDGDGAFPGRAPGAHDQRFRFYGLAVSPAGGMSAVLVMPQSALGPERDNWHNKRTSLLFDFQPPPPGSRADVIDAEHESARLSGLRNLTTEGRMWEYMYGGGPDVVGVTTDMADTDAEQNEAARKREALKNLFKEAVARQTCDLDGRPMRRSGQLTTCGWHSWGTCSTSGLAIMVIGVARSCGVCGSRTLPPALLVKKLPEQRNEILALAAGGFCWSMRWQVPELSYAPNNGHCGGYLLEGPAPSWLVWEGEHIAFAIIIETRLSGSSL